MAQKRLNILGREGSVFHVMTRVVGGQRLFGHGDLEVLRRMMWRVADFTGVEVLTYCLMANHFHVLVRVPPRGVVGDAELVRRFGVLYPRPSRHQPMSAEGLARRLEAGGERAGQLREGLLGRMGDVSWFMRLLKQRFSIWFNHKSERFGTLWAERFKSVLVEGSAHAMGMVAAYIDLNAVRAGLVEDPKDYRFCGYAEAVGRGGAALQGLKAVCGDSGTLREYRCLLFGVGSVPDPRKAGAISPEAALKVLRQQKGRLPGAVALRCRVRYFSDGAVLGSREFVRAQGAAWQQVRRRKRPPGAHEMEGADWGGLHVLRALRAKRFG